MPYILLAPSAYKGSLSAQALACAMESGLRRALVGKEMDFFKRPVADGGDDSLDCLAHLEGMAEVSLNAEDALGRPSPVNYLRRGATAFVELARICGLAKLHREYASGSQDAMLASTIGLGQVIRHAIKDGAREVIIFLGGSASTDGGAGLLHGLGLRFLNEQKVVVRPSGGTLGQIVALEKNSLALLQDDLAGLKFTFACDVENPLLGPQGAAAIFAPQKGADPREVALLEAGLTAFVEFMGSAFPGTAQLATKPGAGAAGGCAFALMVLTGARLCSGFALLDDLLDFRRLLVNSIGVVLAEGCLDSQSLGGKANGEILKLAEELGKPVYVIPGSSLLRIEDEHRFAGIYPSAAGSQRAGLEEVDQAAYLLGKDLRAFLEDA